MNYGKRYYSWNNTFDGTIGLTTPSKVVLTSKVLSFPLRLPEYKLSKPTSSVSFNVLRFQTNFEWNIKDVIKASIVLIRKVHILQCFGCCKYSSILLVCLFLDVVYHSINNILLVTHSFVFRLKLKKFWRLFW